MANGANVTCTITNDDQPAHLTLVKTVTNDNGGTAVPTAWTLAAAGPTPISGTTGSGAVTNATVNAGTYALSESGGPAGYAAGSWSCTAGTLTGASLVLPLGVSATCTINNNDQAATLTLVKTVTNDNGGTAVPTDWTLTAAGPTHDLRDDRLGCGDQRAGQRRHVHPVRVRWPSWATRPAPGRVPPARSPAPAWCCRSACRATCTINNNDQAATLTLVKTVTNDNGGTARADRLDADRDRADHDHRGRPARPR